VELLTRKRGKATEGGGEGKKGAGTVAPRSKQRGKTKLARVREEEKGGPVWGRGKGGCQLEE
jgi:hypothetical protein